MALLVGHTNAMGYGGGAGADVCICLKISVSLWILCFVGCFDSFQRICLPGCVPGTKMVRFVLEGYGSTELAQISLQKHAKYKNLKFRSRFSNTNTVSNGSRNSLSPWKVLSFVRMSLKKLFPSFTRKRQFSSKFSLKLFGRNMHYFAQLYLST